MIDKWIDTIQKLCRPKSVHVCDGSQEEFNRLADKLVHKGIFVPLKKRPGSYWCRTDPRDVARVEEKTFICSQKKEDAGPTNHWSDPQEMMQRLQKLFSGCMEGRTLYVIPYCLGPLNSPFSRFGVQFTDSAYTVCNMKLMTRMGSDVLRAMKGKPFIPGVHSTGGKNDSFWPCDPDNLAIAHFPEEKSIWSFGSGYGGNALLSKKCFALRIASVLGKEEGWLAEHMLIIGVTNPEGKKKYMVAAFPSSCGKTNLAMLKSTLPGWKVTCVGDDIAWLRFGKDGRLYAANPEEGFFGIAPGTSPLTNPNAIDALSKNAIFTNTALTADGDVWWEGLTDQPPPGLTTWKGEAYSPPAAQPNARFTVSIQQSPVLDHEWDNPVGVPIDAILFGGRRASKIPLVREAKNWTEGVFFGASLSSETTAAAEGKIGELRHDPFAMLPFCGYNMGDYFAHWLEMGKKSDKLPRIYSVNWFRKKEGKFLWPGFGENIRVLKWIFERCEGKEAPLDLSGLNVDSKELFSLDLKEEIPLLKKYFSQFGEHFPQELASYLDTLH